MSTTRNAKGQFTKGNTIGEDTRFKPGHYPLNNEYHEEYVDLMYDYFMDDENIFPTLEGFAVKYKIGIRNLKNWVNDPEKYPHLSLAWSQCKARQKEKLLVGGLTSAFNSQIVKFLAINDHEMKDKIEQEVKAEAAFEVKIDVID